jgi:hypothetical protein
VLCFDSSDESRFGDIKRRPLTPSPSPARGEGR